MERIYTFNLELGKEGVYNGLREPYMRSHDEALEAARRYAAERCADSRMRTEGAKVLKIEVIGFREQDVLRMMEDLSRPAAWIWDEAEKTVHRLPVPGRKSERSGQRLLFPC